MDSLKPISSTANLTLDLPPSCIQFCPAYPNYFVIGTYNLQKDDLGPEGEAESSEKKHQSRNGTLLVYWTDGSRLQHVQTVEQPSAILDLRFHPDQENEKGVLAVVSSTGTLAIFRLDPTRSQFSPLHHVITSRCDDLDEGILFLQCNWHPTIKRLIGVTTSSTLARALELDGSWAIRQAHDLDIHNSLEAWCIAFAPGSKMEAGSSDVSVYCGGDDAMLRYSSWSWTDDGGVLTGQASYHPISLRGKHDAGVTAVLPLPIFDESGDRIVITGSYDDHIRLFSLGDLRKTSGMRQARLLVEMNLGGGVWRLDLIFATDTNIRLLASCMHAGARLVEFRREGEEGWAIDVLARFEEHKSMNYGSDFLRRQESDYSRLHCVSTSFYDKLLCLWEFTEG